MFAGSNIDGEATNVGAALNGEETSTLFELTCDVAPLIVVTALIIFTGTDVTGCKKPWGVVETELTFLTSLGLSGIASNDVVERAESLEVMTGNDGTVDTILVLFKSLLTVTEVIVLGKTPSNMLGVVFGVKTLCVVGTKAD